MIRQSTDAPAVQSRPAQKVGRFSLEDAGQAHLVGICGSGMRALAELLSDHGWTVTGSDMEVKNTRLQELGYRVHRGHHPRYLASDADVLVYSTAVGRRNPERAQAARANVVQLSYSEMLGALMRDRIGVSIAGTHGKSTTTAMTSAILTDCGLSPSVVVGAEVIQMGRSGWGGESRLFVVESCEFDRSFHDLGPTHATILGVETDHVDCYRNLDETIDAFREFADRVPRHGSILVSGECEQALSATRTATASVETFSTNSDADWWAADIRSTADGTRFRVFRRGQYFTEVALQLSGRHNVLNALAAIATVHPFGVSTVDIRDSLRDFEGLRRRFETVGSWRGVTLIDDYAHHPTAVRATLRTARERFPRRRILVAFQPHQVSRTTAFLDGFSTSFGDCDSVFLAPVFAARESRRQETVAVARELAGQIAATGQAAQACISLDHLISTLEDEARPGDVLLTIGAGNIDRVHHEFTRRLQRHYTSR